MNSDQKHVQLDVEVLEERIAPGLRLNRCETVVDSPELHVELLEERIAPGFSLGSVNLSGYTFGGTSLSGFDTSGSSQIIAVIVGL